MEIKIDGHKLNYHPYAVGCWMRGSQIFPISIEISPSGTCNHRCTFCSQSYLGYRRRFIDIDALLPRLSEMYDNGTKGVVLAGEGEPMTHPSIDTMVTGIKSLGLDVAMSTNGVLFNSEKAQTILPMLTWIRFSFNGCTSEIYSQVHGCGVKDFNTALSNIINAVKIKHDNNLSTTIGVQYVLFNDNANLDNIEKLIIRFKEIGVDYFSIKPYSIHPLSDKEVTPYDFSCFDKYKRLLESYSSNNFAVLIRNNAIKNIVEPKKYDHCLGVPFWAYIDSNMIVWPCLAYIGEPSTALGDLKTMSYLEIVQSETYRDVIHHFETMDISTCRKSCRLDSINEYLQQISKGVEHINFI